MNDYIIRKNARTETKLMSFQIQATNLINSLDESSDIVFDLTNVNSFKATLFSALMQRDINDFANHT